MSDDFGTSGSCCGCEQSTSEMAIIPVGEKSKHIAPDMKFHDDKAGKLFIFLCEKCTVILARGSITVREIRYMKRTARAARRAFS